MRKFPLGDAPATRARRRAGQTGGGAEPVRKCIITC